MEELIVEVKEGKLRGAINKTVYGFSYASFTGIPFAAPPIGKLRFKDPEPPASWEDVRDATVSADGPLQLFNGTVIGNEDCLYLNVYTQRYFNSKIRKPVMIWIHGGAYLSGNSIIWKPDYLIEKDVVIVSLNYRVGALGFFNLGHEVANGNQGIKDQIAALKWIKQNINVFGGDLNNITIFGNSAGAISGHILAISPLSKGLFHKLILQSGLATLKWVLADNKLDLKLIETKCFQLASILGNDSKEPKEVIEFLQKIPAAEIVQAQNKLYTQKEIRMLYFTFKPIMDEKAKCPVLPRPVSELIDDDSNISIIIGYTPYEYMGVFKGVEQSVFDTLYEDLPTYVERLVGPQEPEKLMRLTQRFKELYFNSEPLTPQNFPSIVQFMSDIHINIEKKRFVDNRRKRKHKALTYFYQFSYYSNENIPNRESYKIPTMPGATHNDELTYLFYVTKNKTCDSQPPVIGTVDFKILETLRTMWTNFAKTGNPTPVVDKYVTVNWLPATTNSFNYLDIDKELRLLTLVDCDDKLRELLK